MLWVQNVYKEMWNNNIFLFIFWESFNLWRPPLIIAQTKIPISFWYRRRLNLKSFIQLSETLPVELTEIHNILFLNKSIWLTHGSSNQDNWSCLTFFVNLHLSLSLSLSLSLYIYIYITYHAYMMSCLQLIYDVMQWIMWQSLNNWDIQFFRRIDTSLFCLLFMENNKGHKGWIEA